MSFLRSSFISERLGTGRSSYPGCHLDQRNNALPAQNLRLLHLGRIRRPLQRPVSPRHRAFFVVLSNIKDGLVAETV